MAKLEVAEGHDIWTFNTLLSQTRSKGEV